MKSAIITGITGQDGAYLAQFLLKKGYKVFGTYRRTATPNFWRIEELGLKNNDNLHLLSNDITDLSSIIRLIEKAKPQEFYNLAAQSFVGTSFDQPIMTSNITGLGVLNVLEAIRLVDNKIKLYQASSSEMYGKVQAIPQNEETMFYPRSPYGVAKLYGHWMCVNYRESYGMFASSGILFNHESPLRGIEFVTRKITDGLARVKLGMQPCISLGNIYAKRDWGYAKEYVEAMWLMLQQDSPDDYVIATEKTTSIKSFINIVCAALDIEIDWKGSGEKEVAVNKKNNNIIIRIDKEFYRSAEVDLLIGSAEKARTKLGWSYKTSVEELARIMTFADLERLKKNS